MVLAAYHGAGGARGVCTFAGDWVHTKCAANGLAGDRNGFSHYDFELSTCAWVWECED